MEYVREWSVSNNVPDSSFSDALPKLEVVSLFCPLRALVSLEVYCDNRSILLASYAGGKSH